MPAKYDGRIWSDRKPEHSIYELDNYSIVACATSVPFFHRKYAFRFGLHLLKI
jgi:hypothetical protein